MSISMTVQEFRALGLQVDPGDHTRAIPAALRADSLPDESWDLERLGSYAETGVNKFYRFKRESIQLGRRSTVQIFRSGHALWLARLKVKWGQWNQWLKEHKIKKTTAWEAIQFYERAGSEEAIRNLTWAQAKRRYGITKPPPIDTQESSECGDKSEVTPSLNPSRDSVSHSDGESGDDEPEDAELDDDYAGLEAPGEPDDIARPPRTVRDMLIVSSNLLLACVERPGDIDAACGDILDQIEASVQILRERIVQCSTEFSPVNAVTGMRLLPKGYVRLTVTSPPYDDLREYGGHRFNFQEIAIELWRITRPGGVVCWHVQDQIVDGSESCTIDQQTLYFRELGFRIYQRLFIVAMAYRISPRRYHRQTSIVLVLSKGRPDTVNLLKDRPNNYAGRLSGGGLRFRRAGRVTDTAVSKDQSQSWCPGRLLGLRYRGEQEHKGPLRIRPRGRDAGTTGSRPDIELLEARRSRA